VKFRGIAISDEKWETTVAYGSYYCEVTVLEVLYDPNSTLSSRDNVTIAYQESLSLHVGDEIECHGINCINCSTCPKQCYGYIVCKPTPYYVVPEFSSLIILPLFMIATLVAIIVYRKKTFVPLQ